MASTLAYNGSDPWLHTRWSPTGRRRCGFYHPRRQMSGRPDYSLVGPTIAAPPTGSRGARFDQQRGRGAGFRASSHVCPRHIHSLRILVGDLKFENLRLLWWIPTRRCYPAALLGFWSVHSPLPVMLNMGTVGGGDGDGNGNRGRLGTVAKYAYRGFWR